MAEFIGTTGADLFTSGDDKKNTFTAGGGGNDIFNSFESDDTIVIDRAPGALFFAGTVTFIDVPTTKDVDIIDLTDFVTAGGVDDLSYSSANDLRNLVIESTTAKLFLIDAFQSEARDNAGYTFRYGDQQIQVAGFTTVSQYESIIDGLVSNTNRNPVQIGSTNLVTDKNKPLVIDLREIAADQEGQDLFFPGFGNPGPGRSVIDANDIMTFTPAKDFIGTDRFAFLADDGERLIRLDFAIEVQAPPPTANDDAARFKAKQVAKGIKIDVLKNDTSDYGKKGLDKASISINEAPDHGSIDFVKGKLLYRPDLSFDGADSFGYTVSDKNGVVSNLATVVITGPDLTPI